MAGLILTANLGGYDNPRALGIEPEPGFYAYMFTRASTPKGWVKQEITYDNSLVRARELKVLAPVHHQNRDHDTVVWTLWMDATMQLKAPVLPWIEKLMESGVDVAAFRHPEFTDAYQEAEACEIRHKDKSENLEKARQLLRSTNFPEGYGHYATGFLWRRNSEKVHEHSYTWWKAMQETTMRDQCTFTWALREVGLECEYLPGLQTKNGIVHYRRGHRK